MPAWLANAPPIERPNPAANTKATIVDADQREVGAIERRQLADGGEGIQWAIKSIKSAVPYPHRGNDQRDAEHPPVEVAGRD
jgi:hypothetical protein